MVSILYEGQKPKLFSIHSACPECGFSFPELDPRHFSFNNPRGACQDCDGLGVIEYEVEDESDGEIYYEYEDCEACDGTRLSEIPRNVLIDKKTITELARLSINELVDSIGRLKIDKKYKLVSEKILEQIKNRLQYICLLYTSPSPRDATLSRMPSSA